jgi:hypothetical protein
MRLLCLWKKRRFHDELLFLVLLGYLHWILHPLCGSTLLRVFACWIYLVGLAPVWQQCFKQVFQFGSTFMWREMRPRGGFHHAILHYWCSDILSCCRGRLFKDINGLCHQTLHCWGRKTLRDLVLLIWWLLDGHARVILELIMVRDYVTLDLVCFGRCCGCYAIFRHIMYVFPRTFWRMYLCWVILGFLWWRMYTRFGLRLDQ